MKDTVDDVKVSGGESLYHVRHQVLPFSWEVLLAYYSDGLTQLLLDWTRRLQHEINDERLDSFSVIGVDLVCSILGDCPVPLDVVLEGDGARYLKISDYQSVLSCRRNATYLDVGLDTLRLQEMEKEDGIVLVDLN